MINALFLAKPIVDMLWKYQFLDMILLLIIVTYFGSRIRSLNFGYESVFIGIFTMLLVRSYTADINFNSTIIVVKILSAVLVFYVARFNKDIDKTFKVIKISYVIPVLIIMLFALTGAGYQYWGNVLTFTGPYYYKTDVATAIIFSIIFFRETFFFSNSNFKRFVTASYVFVIAPYIIFLTNSRMLLLVYGFVILILIYELINYQKVKIPKVLTVFLVIISIVGLIVITQSYNSLNESSNKLAISFDFSEANTQGRSGIWEAIIPKFFSGSSYNVLFGYYINADFDFNTYMNNDAHNVYLKILVNCGLFGLMFYLMFIFYNIFLLQKNIKKYKFNKPVSYRLTTIMLVFLTFLVCGFTQSNIMFTQSSWYGFYLIGLLYSKNITDK